MPVDIFKDCVRPAGDLAGVFEFDEDTGYFYLYDISNSASPRIVDYLHICSYVPDFADHHIELRWTSDQEKVGLFIRDALWAVFIPGTQSKYGGDYRPGRIPSLPVEAKSGFWRGPGPGLA